MRKGGEGSSRQREQPMQRLGGEGEQRAFGAPWREIRWWGQVKIEKEDVRLAQLLVFPAK